MQKRRISNSQIICIILLWVVLCYILITRSETINFQIIFSIVVSGALVFMPIYKNRRNNDKK